jgi:glyoxylase-like metal-dependent hydrolase (beta-lactamase superfamily II)
MLSDTRTFRIGDANVSVINVYSLVANLEELVDAPTNERSQADAALFREPATLSVQCVLIQGAGSTILVDAGDYDPAYDRDRPHYQPPPYLEEQLAGVSVRLDAINHIVITHGHGDHFNATTQQRNGRFQPAFPEARCYLGRADWEQPQMQEALGKEGS